jgi:ABC-type lipoprotein release transport system permease subunit
VTWTTGVLAVSALVVVGIITSTLPARRAAQLPPVDALRYEM